ncbi:MAG: hypothetical protein JO093_16750 [Acidobacteria bacterium]|nr:hypothetical protein [Acidobacteriota bacterium]MBV9070257.1 hypothetical protein [Acidobacteriota bacterium]MBV9187266.1 hypothetical protein [Acidobacteriota bacterium]
MPADDPLEKLASIGSLKREPPNADEIAGPIRTATVRLADAEKETNAAESRFDLAYNAAHALSLAALRLRGYRSEKRYIVFQALPHTLGVDNPTWRLLDRCHRERNTTEYEGVSAVDEKLLTGLIEAANELLVRVRSLV